MIEINLHSSYSYILRSSHKFVNETDDCLKRNKI